ncbi:hypothetical protein VTN02DRAFT_4391 [Thermoascus thermophilus]
MSVSQSEADVIFNRANVALARSQRLVASWLPPKTAEELANAKSEEELQREEDEIFTPVPEKLGLGAPLPQSANDGSWNRTELSSNDKLRRQLLGRNYQKATLKSSSNQPTGKTAPPTAASVSKPEDEEEEEEEGRATLLGKKKNKRKIAATQDDDDDDETPAASETANGGGGSSSSSTKTGTGSRSKKKAGSFLDEILAGRSKKKKK